MIKHGESGEKQEKSSYWEIVSDHLTERSREDIFSDLDGGLSVWFKYAATDDFRLYIGGRGHGDLRRNFPEVDFTYGGSAVLSRRDGKHFISFFPVTGGAIYDTPKDKREEIKELITDYIQQKLKIEIIPENKF